MLFLLTISILVGLLVASGLIALARRRRPLLEHKQSKNLPDPSFRPLFEPGPDELRAAEREERLRLDAATQEDLRAERDQRLAALETLRKTWTAAPERKNTIELLYLASQSESGRRFAEISGEIINLWKNGQIADLSADDLSQLLESHFWLLPAQERTSGVKFSLQQEIASLRRRTHEDN